MKDLPIGKRLLITFGVILGMLLVTVVLGIVSLFSTGQNFEKFYKGAYEVESKAADMKTNIETASKYVGYSMMEEDEGKTAEYVSSAEDLIQGLREGTEYMRENFSDPSLVEKYDAVMQNIKEDRNKVFELAKENRNQEAIALFFTSVKPGFDQAAAYLDQIIEQGSKEADGSFTGAERQKTIATILLAVISLLAIGVTVSMASFIIRSITNPIKILEKAAREMSEGSLKVDIDYQSKDEMGSLAESMRVLTGGISKIVDDVGMILGELGKGNFLVKSSCVDNYIRDYKPILDSMRVIRDNLNDTITKINEASEQVAAGAGQMAQNAQGLAEGATEQAGAIEELTATVESVAGLAEQSANNARQAFEEVEHSSAKAEGGKAEMDKLIHAMDRISETSREIENIITAIEDIASQTNLLSLNASIEAARAGEAGRGFAVVADQIGKLASDSAQSAVNTKELISKTLDEIEDGNSITLRTSKSFTEVIEDMRNFAEVARTTSETSQTQFESLKQVQAGIEQISSVVQSNSAAAEETSATSEELSAQADNLESQVSRFKLMGTA